MGDDFKNGRRGRIAPLDLREKMLRRGRIAGRTIQNRQIQPRAGMARLLGNQLGQNLLSVAKAPLRYCQHRLPV